MLGSERANGRRSVGHRREAGSPAPPLPLNPQTGRAAPAHSQAEGAISRSIAPVPLMDGVIEAAVDRPSPAGAGRGRLTSSLHSRPLALIVLSSSPSDLIDRSIPYPHQHRALPAPSNSRWEPCLVSPRQLGRRLGRAEEEEGEWPRDRLCCHLRERSSVSAYRIAHGSSYFRAAPCH